MNFMVSRGENCITPCDKNLYSDNGTVQLGPLDASMKRPGPTSADNPGHLGSPITGHDGTGTLRGKEWAYNINNGDTGRRGAGFFGKIG